MKATWMGWCMALTLIAGCGTRPGGSGALQGSNDNAQDDTGQSNDNASSDEMSDTDASGSTSSWPRVARLEAFDPQGDDLYGDRVATSGDTILVGTSLKNGLAGIVDSYVLSGGAWRFHSRLEGGPARFPQQGFGSAVATNGRFAFVGAHKFDIAGSFGIQRGGVYVFENVGPQWTQRQLLTASDGEDFEQLGFSLAFDGERSRVICGAPGRARYQGAVYVYALRDSTWDLETRLEPADGIGNDDFGETLAIDGQTIAVGAPGQDFGTGAVYIYDYDTDWTEVQKILAPGVGRTDQFGGALAMQGDTLVIAAPGQKRPGDGLLSAGYVYIYERHDGLWELVQTMIPNDEDAGVYGLSLALDDGTMVVVAGGSQIAILFEQQDGAWSETGRLSSENDTFILDSFGNDLGFDGGVLVVGARSANAGGSRAAGAAFVFTRPGIGTGPEADSGVRF